MPLAKNYTITGPGGDQLIKLHADGAAATDPFRLLKINSGTTSSITGLDVYGGYSDGSGGAIRNEGELTLTNDYIFRNHSDFSGGAISNAGTLTVADCEVYYNDADIGGGGIATTGVCFICCGSRIYRNSAVDFGGGILVSGSSASATMEDSSQIDDNTSVLGGGVYVSVGTFGLTGNSTIHDNTSTSDGGGIYVRGNGFASLTSGGLLDNTSGGVGGGFCVFEGGVFLGDNSLLAGNTAAGKASTNGGAWKAWQDGTPAWVYATPNAVILDPIDSY